MRSNAWASPAGRNTHDPARRRSCLLAMAVVIVVPDPRRADREVRKRPSFELNISLSSSTISPPNGSKKCWRSLKPIFRIRSRRFASKAAGWIVALLSSILSGSMALVNVISLMVVTPIVAFYLLLDWDHMVAKVDSWLPRDHAETVRCHRPRNRRGARGVHSWPGHVMPASRYLLRYGPVAGGSLSSGWPLAS